MNFTVLASAFEMFPLSFIKFYDAIQNFGLKKQKGKKKQGKHAINKTVHDAKEKNLSAFIMMSSNCQLCA